MNTRKKPSVDHLRAKLQFRHFIINSTTPGRLEKLNELIDEIKRTAPSRLILSVVDTPDSGDCDQ